MLVLTKEQVKPFKLLQDGGRDNALSAIYGNGLADMAHGEWAGSFAPLNSIEREQLAVAIATGNYKVETTPLEAVQKMILTYQKRSTAVKGREQELCQDIVTELNDLKKIIEKGE
ncbi:hypothetical protein [Bacillus amyloliquefaciens]|uniref:hypothetical protein n=1 Tax=Bacillus amyloliquefaciens TaxID=1390 RepID=UPI002DB6C80B|nr:hypothetical protein [Bacillus amyloliquefaciens]MEC3841540.1 hypothetical protein [Bacillus amyloliquefaciens]